MFSSRSSRVSSVMLSRTPSTQSARLSHPWTSSTPSSAKAALCTVSVAKCNAVKSAVGSGFEVSMVFRQIVWSLYLAFRMGGFHGFSECT